METQTDNNQQSRTLSVKQPGDTKTTYDTFCDKQAKFDITKFRIASACRIGNYIIAFVTYRDFNELNGSKVLVWQGLSIEDYKLLDRMDPRFDPMSKLFAVFKPTREGFNRAVDIFHTIQGKYIDEKLYMSEEAFAEVLKSYDA